MVMRKSVSVACEFSNHVSELAKKIGFRSPFKNGYLALKSAYLLILHYHQQLVVNLRRNQNCRDTLHRTFIKLNHDWLRKNPCADFAHDELVAKVHDAGYMALCNIRYYHIYLWMNYLIVQLE